MYHFLCVFKCVSRVVIHFAVRSLKTNQRMVLTHHLNKSQHSLAGEQKVQHGSWNSQFPSEKNGEPIQRSCHFYNWRKWVYWFSYRLHLYNQYLAIQISGVSIPLLEWVSPKFPALNRSIFFFSLWSIHNSANLNCMQKQVIINFTTV